MILLVLQGSCLYELLIDLSHPATNNCTHIQPSSLTVPKQMHSLFVQKMNAVYTTQRRYRPLQGTTRPKIYACFHVLFMFVTQIQNYYDTENIIYLYLCLLLFIWLHFDLEIYIRHLYCKKIFLLFKEKDRAGKNLFSLVLLNPPTTYIMIRNPIIIMSIQFRWRLTDLFIV